MNMLYRKNVYMTITYINKKHEKITEDFLLVKTRLIYDNYMGEKLDFTFKDKKSFIKLFLIYINEIRFNKTLFSNKEYVVIKDKTGNKSKIYINDIKSITMSIVYNYENNKSILNPKEELSISDFNRYLNDINKNDDTNTVLTKMPS